MWCALRMGLRLWFGALLGRVGCRTIFRLRRAIGIVRLWRRFRPILLHLPLLRHVLMRAFGRLIPFLLGILRLCVVLLRLGARRRCVA